MRIIFAIFVLLQAVISAQEPRKTHFERGSYYRNPDCNFEMWLPAGIFSTSKIPGTLASYSSRGRKGISAIVIKIVPTGTIREYIEYWKNGSSKQFPGCEFEVIEDIKIGGLPAAEVIHKNLEGNDEFKGDELVHVGIPLEERTLDFSFIFKVPNKEIALAEMRWVLKNLLFSGDEGLDPYLQSRVVHLQSGLSYRAPTGFQEAAAGVDGHLYSGVHPETAVRIQVVRARDRSPEDLLAGVEKLGRRLRMPWKFPHPGTLELRGSCLLNRDRAHVVVSVAVRKGLLFRIDATASADSREELIRSAELFGMGLRYIDIATARGRIESALRDYDLAVQRKNAREIERQIRILVEHNYLDEATDALIRILPRMKDTNAQLLAAKGLEVNRPGVSPELVKLAKNGHVRKSPQVLAAVLRTLGFAKSKEAYAFLLRNLSHRDARVCAAVVVALGCYPERGLRLVRELFKRMTREEKAGRNPSFDARQRWIALLPAYQEALKRLTGARFQSAEDVRRWLKKKR